MTLEGYWPLHDDQARDLSGNENHGTLNGEVTTGVAGRGGLEAMSFDGSDDEVTLPTGTAPNSSYTVCLWFKVDDFSADHTQFSFSGGNQTVEIRTETDSKQYFYHHDGGSYKSISVTVDSDEWYFLVATYDENETSLYIDGSLVGTYPLSGTDTQSGSNRIGAAGGGGREFKGKLCNVRVYNRALAQAEVQQLYEMGGADVARPRQDGVARYKLDGDASDSWGSNDGTNNGAVFTDDSIRGQSGSFDGSGEYVEISDSSDFNFGTSSWSISTWFKSSDTSESGNVLVSKSKKNSGYVWWALQADTDGKIGFTVDDNGSIGFTKITSNSSVLTGDWHHATAIVDSEESLIKLYINGVLNSTADISGFDSLTNSYPITFMKRHYDQSQFTSGKLDDVRIYDYALSPSEVHELYRWGTKGRDLRKHLVNRRQ